MSRMLTITIATLFCSVAIAETKKQHAIEEAKKTESALTPAATAAVSLAKIWQQGDPIPAPGENGAVIYRYGAAMPPIVCAPERLTIILLEAGEKVQSQPMMGDTSRWDYQLMVAGEGPTARTGVVIKPKRPELSTDLVIATNRRSYQLQLISKPTEHLSQVEFSYPLSANWIEYQADRMKAEEQRKEDQRKDTVAELRGKPNFAYNVKSHQPVPFRPRAVYDDGHQTFLKMPPEAKNWDTAVLQTAGPNGCEIVNYRVNGDTWIIDRLFTSAELISGTGRQALRLSIFREGAKAMECGKKK